ncbi:MAG: AAA family ATPase [Nitrosopumilus sp.]|nr:AAA family ATPase [Nitrosopumilus sp.]
MDTNHNYQPVFIKTLLQNSGTATQIQIKQALTEANPEVLVAKDSHLTARNALVNHGVVKDNNDGTYSLTYDGSYDSMKILELVKACDDKIAEASTYSSRTSRRLVLFSVSGDASFAHFEDTMQKDVDTSQLSDTKMKKFPKIRAWGAIPNKWALSKWSKLQSGDILLFYKDKQYITSAILEGTEQNLTVAKQMWGTKPDSDSTWELIMYMKPESVMTTSVGYQTFNKFLNYKENFMPTRTLDFTLVRSDATKDLEKSHGSLENALSSIGFNFKKTISISPGSAAPGCEENHNCYVPYALRVNKDETVTWSNDDSAAHTITSGTPDGGPDGHFDSGLIMTGSTFSHKFEQDGEYPYHCKVHPWMEGKVIVDKQISESENYLLLRHKAKGSKWVDDLGKVYHTGKIPNYKKLSPGTKTIWYDRTDGQYQFWGYGDISKIEENDGEFFVRFDNFEFFNPDKSLKIGTDSIKQKITNLPGFNQQISMLQINKEIYDEIMSGKIIAKSFANTFDDESLPLPSQEDLKRGYEKISDELLLPRSKVIEIVTALASGRHVLLAGPIGTGKTRLAKVIPEVFWSSIGGYYSEDHTATADWSTQDVIGGIFPKMENGQPIYDIQNGCVVETVAKNWKHGISGGGRVYSDSTQSFRGTWLIIDEFNRADIDKAFGQLFTALRTRVLKIPTDQKGISYNTLKIPEDYRIIGTLNTADKHFLFQLSDALKSRFAYIEIDIPSKEEFEKEIYYAMKNAIEELGNDNYESLIALDHDNKKIDRDSSDDDFYNRVFQAYFFLDLVRTFKKLGTAILKLVYQNILVGTKLTGDSKLALDNSLKSNLIPQLENLSRSAIGSIQSLYSQDIAEFFKKAYKNPNRQSYSDEFAKVLNYLEISNAARLSAEFSNGTLQVDNESTWVPIKTAHEKKKNEFEQELNQLKQSLDDLLKSVVI